MEVEGKEIIKMSNLNNRSDKKFEECFENFFEQQVMKPRPEYNLGNALIGNYTEDELNKWKPECKYFFLLGVGFGLDDTREQIEKVLIERR